ncbi:hypothetical protein ACIQOW_30745 [Kitasatospora sp. NPDC091335]|uniref:hypothetical protein n=1 Tax=Kitasatospora sp. NPDC091335 TaxID=3364085 RepID=UPI00381135EB
MTVRTVRTVRTGRRRTAAAAVAAALTAGALLAAPAAATPSATPAVPAVPAVPAAGAGAGATLPMTVLSTGLPDKPYSDPTGLNNAGVVVGYAWASGQGGTSSAIRWNADRSPAVLPPLPGEDNAQALGVNDAGTVIGTSWPAPRSRTEATAVRWSAGGTPTALAPLPGDTYSRPVAISASGIVAGVSSHGGEDHAVAWHPDGTAVALAPLPGDTRSEAFDVNSAGFAVGVCATGGAGEPHAVLWSPDGTAAAFVTDPGAVRSWARRINDAGAVVGWADLPEPGLGSLRHGLLRSAGGVLHDLGPSTYPDALNSSGEAVGDYQPDPQVPRNHAARWSPQGVLTALDPAPPGGRTTATDINDSGTAVGYAWDGIPSRQYQSGRIWARGAAAENLDPTGATNSARLVNNSGLVVGLWLPRGAGDLYPYHVAAVWRP